MVRLNGNLSKIAPGDWSRLSRGVRLQLSIFGLKDGDQNGEKSSEFFTGSTKEQ